MAREIIAGPTRGVRALVAEGVWRTLLMYLHFGEILGDRG
jgi:hypothetical protein